MILTQILKLNGRGDAIPASASLRADATRARHIEVFGDMISMRIPGGRAPDLS
jgi:hypothetical protein